MTPLSISPAGVDLWIVFTSDVDDDLLGEYGLLLSLEERSRARRFHFDRDRRAHVIARGLVRTALCRYAPLSPEEWRFETNRYGRPALSPDQFAAAPLTFNLSHTDGMIVLAVRRELAVGVDVENVWRHRVSCEIADRFFSAAEAATLRMASPDELQVRFFEYWTLKESYVKARGAGLSIPLDQFSFTFPSGAHIGLEMDGALGDTPARWRLWQFRPSAEHLVSVCAERAWDRLNVRRVIPLRTEEPFECAAVRDSCLIEAGV